MKTTITVTQEVELNATFPLFICYGNSIYHRFCELENKEIEVLRFSFDVTSSMRFELQNRNYVAPCEVGMINLTEKYAKQITEEEFNSKLSELLNKYVYGKEIVGTLELTPEQQKQAEREAEEHGTFILEL